MKKVKKSEKCSKNEKYTHNEILRWCSSEKHFTIFEILPTGKTKKKVFLKKIKNLRFWEGRFFEKSIFLDHFSASFKYSIHTESWSEKTSKKSTFWDPPCKFFQVPKIQKNGKNSDDFKNGQNWEAPLKTWYHGIIFRVK